MTVKSAEKTLRKWWGSTSHFVIPFLAAALLLIVSSVLSGWVSLVLLLAMVAYVGLSFVRVEFGDEVLKTDAERKREVDESERMMEELIREEEAEAKRTDDADAAKQGSSKGRKPDSKGGKRAK